MSKKKKEIKGLERKITSLIISSPNREFNYKQIAAKLQISDTDGKTQILKKLAKEGSMKIVAIPKTIDNDVGATESSIGFHTAVDVATQALDNLQSTAASHRRYCSR